MAALNPMQLLSMLKGGNPQAVAEQIIQQNFPNDPTMQNILQMGRSQCSNYLASLPAPAAAPTPAVAMVEMPANNSIQKGADK